MEEEVWFITDLCVSCRVMGRGIGKQMINSIIERAKDQGVKLIKAVVKPNKDNFRMPKLYKSLGFKGYKEKGPNEEEIIVYEKVI